MSGINCREDTTAPPAIIPLRTKPAATKTFRLELGCEHGRDEMELRDGYVYRLYFVVEVECLMDQGSVWKLGRMWRHQLIDWRLWIGSDWMPVSESYAKQLFRDWYRVRRNRQSLFELCKQANHE